MTGRVLILGGTGRFGRHAAEAFWNAGWRISLFDRASGDLTGAARGMDMIVNGWNPPYPDWAAQLPGLTRQVIAAARASGATILQPANVYVYGAAAPAPFGAATAQAATNPLGRLRIGMEQAFRESGVPTILLRAGDFLEDEASGNWFDRVIAPALPKGVLTWPGDPGIPHAWAWLPDMARAAVALPERRESLPRFADIAFPGYTLSGHDIAALCAAALGQEVRLRRMSWFPLQLARPFWRMAAPLLEMRYLWDKPHRMDPAGFDALLPGFRATDPAEALSRAIAPVIAARGRPRPGGAAPHPLPVA